MNINEIENDSFLTKECMNAVSVEAFYEKLKSEEAHYQKLFSSAAMLVTTACHIFLKGAILFFW